MRILFLFPLLGLVGCQSAAPVAPLPQPAMPAAEPVAPVPTVSATLPLERKIRQQAQYIEALMSQNDALTARLAQSGLPAREPGPAAPAAVTNLPAVAPVVPAAAAREPAIAPNADGMIDLAALVPGSRSGEAVNPFVVRTLPNDAVREITLQVSGIIAGSTPCAVINTRLVQQGDSLESLTVARVEPDAVLLRHGGQLLRLPVSEKAVRLRLPL